MRRRGGVALQIKMNWSAWAAPETTTNTSSHAHPHRHARANQLKQATTEEVGFLGSAPSHLPPHHRIFPRAPSRPPRTRFPAYGDSDLPAPSRVIVPATTVQDEQQPRIADPRSPVEPQKPGRMRQIRASGEGWPWISKGGNQFQGCLRADTIL